MLGLPPLGLQKVKASMSAKLHAQVLWQTHQHSACRMHGVGARLGIGRLLDMMWSRLCCGFGSCRAP